MTKLKIWRENADMTQLELAGKSGISLRTLQDYEQGAKPINKAAAITVYKLAKALNVDIEKLLEI